MLFAEGGCDQAVSPMRILERSIERRGVHKETRCFAIEEDIGPKILVMRSHARRRPVTKSNIGRVPRHTQAFSQVAYGLGKAEFDRLPVILIGASDNLDGELHTFAGGDE